MAIHCLSFDLEQAFNGRRVSDKTVNSNNRTFARFHFLAVLVGCVAYFPHLKALLNCGYRSAHLVDLLDVY